MSVEIIVETQHLMPGSDTRVTRVCDDCGRENIMRFHHILSGRLRSNNRDVCRGCAKNKLMIVNARSGKNLLAVFPEVASSWHPVKNQTLTPRDVLPSSNKLRWWMCEKGHEWESTVDNRTKGTGCRVCGESKGEQAIREWLDVNKVNYTAQASIEGLCGIGGRPLLFDFALSTDNSVYMYIEYDGEQHFEPRPFHGRDYASSCNQLEIQQEHDKRKNEWCEINNIPLLRIKYDQFKLIDTILTEKVGVVTIG